MKIAVVGGGVAGLTAAWLLRKDHDVCLYEKDSVVGGHAHTEHLSFRDREFPVDTAFIQFCTERYPTFSRLLDYLRVPSHSVPTSFSCHIEGRDVQYVYGPQRTRFLARLSDWRQPAFRRTMWETVRFFRNARELLDHGNGAGNHAHGLTVGAYLEREGYSREFAFNLLLPMAAALWSLPLQACAELDAAAFVGAVSDAGYLSFWRRQHWQTVSGGSHQYVSRLAASLDGRIRTGTEVCRVVRHQDRVVIRDSRGGEDTFDHVIMASHADQTLRVLGDASDSERRILGGFRYFANTLYLHHDLTLMPQSLSRWATWNYFARDDNTDANRPVSHTYWMNRLQGLDENFPTFVSLNPFRPPADDLVERIFHYHHPTLDAATVSGQRSLPQIQGVNRTWFCGAAYYRWGSHEDALCTGLQVARAFGADLPWARRDA
ncbi:MAG: NAD(P)/FAD-dependent oxidoreductase [Vicinamibacterales bacterium]